MALTNYSGLASAVSTWSHRTDVASSISDFVTLVEAELNERLRTGAQETSATLTSATNTAALPSDFAAVRSIQLDASTPVLLEYLSPHQLVELGSRTGPPKYYTLTLGQVQFDSTPSASSTYTLDYYAKLPSVITNSTNWLMTNHPLVYFYGTMAKVALFAKNDADLAKWEPMYKEAVAAVMGSDARDRWSGTPLVIRPQVPVQ